MSTISQIHHIVIAYLIITSEEAKNKLITYLSQWKQLIKFTNKVINFNMHFTSMNKKIINSFVKHSVANIHVHETFLNLYKVYKTWNEDNKLNK